MDKQINFEDTIFILNVRIRMLLDLLCLDINPDVHLEKTLDDLSFIDNILNSLYKYLTENRAFLDREDELDKLTDLEFRFDQLLTGIGRSFPAAGERAFFYRNSSAERRHKLDETRSPAEQSASEPVVTYQELNELLREF